MSRAPLTPGVLLVGEDNPYGTDPRYALYHEPAGASGDRLRRHLGLSITNYTRLGKINLCGGRWDLADARRTASCLVLTATSENLIVLLGAKVRDAFTPHVRLQQFFDGYRVRIANGIEPRFALLPHPSGRNRMWNGLETERRAWELLRKLAPDVPWGQLVGEDT